MELVIPLAKKGEPVFRQVYFGLRQLILSGSWRAGDRFPSTGDLAEQLGIPRTVILLAYEQLLEEGFASSRGGSGTYVSEGLGGSKLKKTEKSAKLRLSRYGSAAADVAATVDFPGRRSIPLRYDFAYGRGDVAKFPFEMWRRMLLRQAPKAPGREPYYCAPAGSLALREAITVHLRRSRAVICDPSQVIV